jgi:ribonuclease HI
MTNNVAEYSGLLLILKWFNAHEPKERLHIVGDARLVIRRMTRKAAKPPAGICASLADDCLLAASWRRRWLSFEWQSREQNGECDTMCQLAITEEIARHSPNFGILPTFRG